MLIKPDTTGANPSAASVQAATACGNCGAEERRLLHHVRHRGIFRRLCTSCVLRLHPQSFCPTCFQVYPPAPSHDAVLTCFKCYSSSHSHCVEAAVPTSPASPYICPLCILPNTPIFKLKSAKEANMGATMVRSEDCRVMDRDAGKKLLAAAKIASASMNKAAAAAKAEAERRAKEAAYTRKRAKEALEYVAHLVMKEKLRKKEAGLAGPTGAGIIVSYNTGGGINRVNSSVNANSASYRNGNAASVLGRMDNSNQVLAALNAVGLKENEKTRGGITGRGAGLGVRVAADRVPMDVDGNNDGGGDHVNFADMESGVENADAQGEKLEDIDNDEVDLVRALEEQMQHEEEEEEEDEENSHGGEQDDNRPQL